MTMSTCLEAVSSFMSTQSLPTFEVAVFFWNLQSAARKSKDLQMGWVSYDT